MIWAQWRLLKGEGYKRTMPLTPLLQPVLYTPDNEDFSRYAFSIRLNLSLFSTGHNTNTNVLGLLEVLILSFMTHV